MLNLRCSYCATNFCGHNCECKCKCHAKTWTKNQS